MSTAEPAGPTGHARGPMWQRDTTLPHWATLPSWDAAAFNMAKCCVTCGKALYLDSNIKEGKAFNLPVEAEDTPLLSSLVVKTFF